MRCAIVLLAIGVAIALVYGDRVRENFGRPQWEDDRFFQYDASITSFADAFRHSSSWEGLYRPLSTNVYYRLGRLLFDNRLTVYHTVNLCLFAANALLVYWACRSFASFFFSLCVSVLFATRAASTEVLLYSSQIQSLLPAFFSLLALRAYLTALAARRAPLYFALSTVLLALGLLSKESVVTLPFICLSFALLGLRAGTELSWRRNFGRTALALLPLLAIPLWLLFASPYLRIGDNPWWSYESEPREVAGNYVAYALSFLNEIVAPVYPAHPCVKLNSYPAIVRARADVLVQTGCLLVFALGALSVLGVGAMRPLRRPSLALRGGLAGFSIFALALAPSVILQRRLLMYYGYFGHFGLSLLVVAVASRPAHAIARYARARRSRALDVQTGAARR